VVPSSSDPAERRRRRALLRAHHPDLGGDPEEFIRVLAAMRSGRSTASSSPGDDVRFVRRPRGLARIAAWCRQRRNRRSGPPRVL
jgi:hypothetical protein